MFTSVAPSLSSSPRARDIASALFAIQLTSCPTWRSHIGTNTTHQFQSTCVVVRRVVSTHACIERSQNESTESDFSIVHRSACVRLRSPAKQ